MTHFTSHNLSAIGHVEMLKAQWRVLVALMLRDLRSRHGSVLGFAVPILYPLGHILLLLIWSSLAHRAVPYGDSGALWYATGIVPFMSFSYMSRFTMMGVVQNKSLLSFAVVKINDIVFSRAIVEILRSTIVIIILVLLFWYYDIDFVPLQISQFFFALFASLFLGLGFGVLNAIIATLAPSWLIVSALITIALWIASGVFFVAESLPEQIQEILSYIPTVHMIEWTRSAYYEGYGGRLLDKGYLLSFAVGSLFLGLLIERFLRGRLLR